IRGSYDTPVPTLAAPLFTRGISFHKLYLKHFFTQHIKTKHAHIYAYIIFHALI
uniref:Uncharacterized protein n=1 Tax=Ciona intestinalis TaxID=7719 RepID=H2XVN5_CIOIN